MLEDRSALSGSQEMCLVVENTGTATWTANDRIHIGTASPRDRASAYYHPSWIGTNRITSFVEPQVPPGATATFTFRITPSPEPPSENFQLVVENVHWLPEPRFHIQPFDAEPDRPSVARTLRHLLSSSATRAAGTDTPWPCRSGLSGSPPFPMRARGGN
jgi:hypothetical protein